MSDTPVDRNLDSRKSTRYPEHLHDAVSQFQSEYNEMLAQSGMTDEQTDQFTLDSMSDTRRRLVDLGLAVWAQDDGIPHGFTIDPSAWGDDDAEPVCPDCGTDDPLKLRVSATAQEESETVNFESVTCLDCGHTTHISQVLKSQPQSLF